MFKYAYSSLYTLTHTRTNVYMQSVKAELFVVFSPEIPFCNAIDPDPWLFEFPKNKDGFT